MSTDDVPDLDVARSRRRPHHPALVQREHGGRPPGPCGPPELDDDVRSALWSAVHALEETASTARWWQTRPHAPTYLGDKIEKLEREASVLRDVLGCLAAVS